MLTRIYLVSTRLATLNITLKHEQNADTHMKPEKILCLYRPARHSEHPFLSRKTTERLTKKKQQTQKNALVQMKIRKNKS
jgi:hypothetical protein